MGHIINCFIFLLQNSYFFTEFTCKDLKSQGKNMKYAINSVFYLICNYVEINTCTMSYSNK